MSWRIILRLVFPVACVFCLAAGYGMAGKWLVLLGVLVVLAAWLLACRWRYGWLATVALVLSVGLAATGLFASASPVLMMLGVTLAMAGWDGLLWDRRQADHSSDKAIGLLEKRHYQSLALALGFGLLLALGGRVFRIQIPFAWVIFLVILVLAGLAQFWQTLRE